MNYFTIAISTIENILSTLDYKIVHQKDSSYVYKPTNPTIKVDVPHSLIKLYLTDNKKYKSYNLFLDIYNKYKDSTTEVSKRKTIEAQTNLNKLIQIYAVKYLYNELKNKNLIPSNPVLK